MSGSIYPKPFRLHSQSTSLAWGRFTPRSRYALTEHKSRLGSLHSPVSLCTHRAQVSPGVASLPGLAMHSQSTSLAWGRFTPRSRYALTEHKSRLGSLHSPVSLCTHRAQVSPGVASLPGLAMHSQSTSLAWGRFTPRSRYAVLQRWLHGPLRWAGQQSRYFE
ncbi:hypothetical protein C8P63_12349 [Melghirimyces profundicolus]|uniref:Uncharacterized protein n=1 Tax=Melghirimyces profundicolus TaxID=1242148 RepID=A0A2T6BG46_9BACL|nr:hypothetical protein C8P63_12349 [Melghirimyces profundicolus]